MNDQKEMPRIHLKNEEIIEFIFKELMELKLLYIFFKALFYVDVQYLNNFISASPKRLKSRKHKNLEPRLATFKQALKSLSYYMRKSLVAWYYCIYLSLECFMQHFGYGIANSINSISQFDGIVLYKVQNTNQELSIPSYQKIPNIQDENGDGVQSWMMFSDTP